MTATSIENRFQLLAEGIALAVQPLDDEPTDDRRELFLRLPAETRTTFESLCSELREREPGEETLALIRRIKQVLAQAQEESKGSSSVEFDDLVDDLFTELREPLNQIAHVSELALSPKRLAEELLGKIDRTEEDDLVMWEAFLGPYRLALGTDGVDRVLGGCWERIQTDLTGPPRQLVHQVIEHEAALRGDWEMLFDLAEQDDSRPQLAHAVDLLRRHGHDDQALALCERALTSYPRADLERRRAQLLAGKGQTEAALGGYERAFQLVPTPTAYRELREFCETRDLWPLQRERALGLLRAAVAEQSEVKESVFTGLLAVELLDAGRNGEAAQVARRRDCPTKVRLQVEAAASKARRGLSNLWGLR